MNRNFAAVQQKVEQAPQLSDVRLVTMTLDPEYDTPEVLAPLARTLDADPGVWSFMTGEPDDVVEFSKQFGIFSERDPDDPVQLIHNLRTAVIDPEGRLVKIESGNSWTPAQLIADLEAAPAPAH
jgi:protein SCO1/2